MWFLFEICFLREKRQSARWTRGRSTAEGPQVDLGAQGLVGEGGLCGCQPTRESWTDERMKGPRRCVCVCAQRGRHAWFMLMGPLVCACWAAVTCLHAPPPPRVWGRGHVSAASVFVLFSTLPDVRLTDSIHSADTARCVTISPASLGCVYTCVCIRVCLRSRWVFDPPSYLRHPAVFVFTTRATTSAPASLGTGRSLSFIITHTHTRTHLTAGPRHGTDNKHVDAVTQEYLLTRPSNSTSQIKKRHQLGVCWKSFLVVVGFKRSWVTALGLLWPGIVFWANPKASLIRLYLVECARTLSSPLRNPGIGGALRSRFHRERRRRLACGGSPLQVRDQNRTF